MHDRFIILNYRPNNKMRGAPLSIPLDFMVINFYFRRPDVQAGADLYVVSRLLGHRDVSTTQRYAHHNVESVRAAIAKLQPSGREGCGQVVDRDFNAAQNILQFGQLQVRQELSKPLKRSGRGGAVMPLGELRSPSIH